MIGLENGQVSKGHGGEVKGNTFVFMLGKSRERTEDEIVLKLTPPLSKIPKNSAIRSWQAATTDLEACTEVEVF